LYLKALEIQGFKSFPDKTVLSFGRGVTAVVGPNGSGKSNIVDAIRWVLGEQSTKTLRGGKMEDVIFGGTVRRSKMGFCEVTLVLDNGDGGIPLDYAEVSVTRRYYRTGDSEFYINRKSVRLRDIHELFMDTGLGRDGYSIIGQGRIDEILSVKSADRREIFEEAAGITKFRYRKEESERKLAGCEENLVRLRDIISELESQVEPLHKQAEKAKSYLILRDELRVLEVSVWLDSLEKLKDTLQAAQTDFDNAERMLTARRRELDELHEKSEQFTREMHEKDVLGEEIREQLRKIEADESEMRSRIAVNQANIKNNEDNILSKTQELSRQTQQGDSLAEQKQEALDRIAALEQQVTQLQQQLDQQLEQVQQAARSAQDLSLRLDALTAAIQQEQTQQAQAEAALSARKTALEEEAQRAEAALQEQAALEQRLEQEQARAAQLRRDIEENEEKKQSALNMLRGFALRVETRRKKTQQLQQEQEQTRRDYNAKADRLNMLQAMAKEYEGFSHAVKKVMQAADSGRLQRIHGPVSTLIRTDDRYSVAIEIALGAAMQNIVVDSEQDAKAGIQFLKKGDLGRATFLPLSAVKNWGGKRRDLQGEAGFLGYADALLTFDSQYRQLMNSLLGNTVVADHIDSAIAMAKKHGYAFRIVTLDGQLINPSGAMTGGSLNKNNTGVLSRANEITRLEQQLQQLEVQLEQQDKTLRQAQRELEAADYESGVAKDELRQAEDLLLQLSAQQTQHGALLDTLQARILQLQQEKDNRQQRRQEQQAQMEALRQQAAEHAAAAAQLTDQRQQLAGGQAEAQQQASLLAEQLSALRADIAAATSQRETMQSNVASLDQLIAQMGSDLQDKEAVIACLRSNNEVLRQQVAEQEQICIGYAQQAQHERQRLSQVTENRLQLEGARARNEKEIQEKNNTLINLERERGYLANRKAQAEMEEDSIIQKLWDNYELTRVTAQAVRQELESLPKANRRIGELRGSIKKLGDVNVGSIEEYEKVSQRFEFLSAQRDDLENARRDLLKIIGDLTGNMQSIFGEQFRRINESFQRTFTEIFGGGSAYLKLEDENDILNCGIEIKVELPGKSMRAISLLSGGEKAFVAIALYFAIIKVRPTPFCVLDEIEAALDDVNVNRFSDYMRTLCDKTQFVVITHRRGTMEGADVLYGVTMQEQGVTKLLALNISEVEKQIKIKPN